MRTPLIAGNWKMNLNCRSGIRLVNDIMIGLGNTGVEVAVCCPAPLLQCINEAIIGSSIRLGAQNMHWEDAGAFTGEISADMLKETGVSYVIIGHSERRQLFGETDVMVNRKVRKALERTLSPILCIGETLEEREAAKTFEILKKQIDEGIRGVNHQDMKQIVIAYEPIWAIGTGKTASPEQANEAIGFIRRQIESSYGDEISEDIRILYGGSVKPENATEIMDCEEIDGALVGGASLNEKDFLSIIHF